MNLPSKEKMAELCRQCDAWCCRYALDKLNKLDEGSPKYWNAVKYQKTRCLEHWVDGKFIRFVHDCPCKELDQDTGLCKIYETRPEVCKLFPTPLHYKSGWRFKCEIIKWINSHNEDEGDIEYGDL